jgi:CRP-like cAMP-binding protein
MFFRMPATLNLQSILQNSILRSIEEGAFFFFQGDPADLFVCADQRYNVKLLQSNPNGKQVNIRTVQPGKMFAVARRGSKRGYLPCHAPRLSQESAALVIRSGFMNEMMQTRPHLSIALTAPDDIEYSGNPGALS